jgi:hypothetical protein
MESQSFAPAKWGEKHPDYMKRRGDRNETVKCLRHLEREGASRGREYRQASVHIALQHGLHFDVWIAFRLSVGAHLGT